MSVMAPPRGRSPEVLAKRRSTCRHCDQEIIPGEHYISRADGRKDFMHALCAEEYLRGRETFEELNREDAA